MTDDPYTFEVFPFRYRDARTGKWVTVGNEATPAEIQAHYAEPTLTGGREILQSRAG